MEIFIGVVVNNNTESRLHPRITGFKWQLTLTTGFIQEYLASSNNTESKFQPGIAGFMQSRFYTERAGLLFYTNIRMFASFFF